MKKTLQLITICLFLGCLVFVLAGTVLIPKPGFSETEKRYLTEFPAPDWGTVSSGAWGEKLESWLADHIPARSFFVGLDAYKDLLLGQQNAKEIRLLDGRLIEAPVNADEAALERNLSAIAKFAAEASAPVTVSLVPSAGWAMGGADYRDAALIADILSRSSGCWQALDLTDVFAGRPDLFYRTDHHWTSAGAYTGYQQIAGFFGKAVKPEDAFAKEVLPDCFQGSTFSRSALWLTKPETMELWHGSDAISVTASDSEDAHGVFFRERLEEADKYTVFLNGNHPIVRLTNPECSGKLLVIRDSYSNCLGPFLAESWGEIVMVDLRYYRSPVSKLAEEEQPDDILILYSIGNFLTDANIVLLR